MTEPDEALLWAREQLVTFWEKAHGVRAADRAVHINNARSGASDGDLEEAVTGRLHWLDGNRAGAAASAARIKELEARVAELEAALKPLAALAEKTGTKPKDESCWCGQDGAVIRFGDIRRARALLKDPDQ